MFWTEKHRPARRAFFFTASIVFLLLSAVACNSSALPDNKDGDPDVSAFSEIGASERSNPFPTLTGLSVRQEAIENLQVLDTDKVPLEDGAASFILPGATGLPRDAEVSLRISILDEADLPLAVFYTNSRLLSTESTPGALFLTGSAEYPDDDGDGFTNLAEKLSGADPRATADLPPLDGPRSEVFDVERDVSLVEGILSIEGRKGLFPAGFSILLRNTGDGSEVGGYADAEGGGSLRIGAAPGDRLEVYTRNEATGELSGVYLSFEAPQEKGSAADGETLVLVSPDRRFDGAYDVEYVSVTSKSALGYDLLRVRGTKPDGSFCLLAFRVPSLQRLRYGSALRTGVYNPASVSVVTGPDGSDTSPEKEGNFSAAGAMDAQLTVVEAGEPGAVLQALTGSSFSVS